MPDRFKQAIKRMYEDGEIDKIIAHAPNHRERKEAKRFKAMLDSWTNEKYSIDDIPIIALIHECKSYSIWQDALVYMELKCDFDIEEDEKCE